MKKLVLGSMFGAALALAVGCAGSVGPDTGQAARPVVSLSPDEVPSDLAQCQARFGEFQRWPDPDAAYGVEGQPNVVVLVRDGRAICRTGMHRYLELQTSMHRFADVQATSNDDGGDVDKGDADEPVDDSNPLPAKPCADGNAAKNPGDDAGDSNPLPANPGVAQGSAESHGDRGDSNPLPAHDGAAVQVNDEQRNSVTDLL